MRKRIIVACGGAVATSTVAAQGIRELCRKHKIEADLVQLRISEIDSHLYGTDLIVSTAPLKKKYDIPVIHGLPFISGVGLEKTEEEILKVLKGA